MIGNDIIDLEVFKKETNWKRPNYLKKLFTKKEQNQILSAEDPEIIIALFWAMKEACYKAHQRKFALPRKYNPSAFECIIPKNVSEAKLKGTVQVGEKIYDVDIIKTNSYIHCAVIPTQQKIIQKIFKEEVDIKSSLITLYSEIKQISTDEISIEKDENFIPHLMYKGNIENTLFSISHHGKFSAFVLALTNS